MSSRAVLTLLWLAVSPLGCADDASPDAADDFLDAADDFLDAAETLDSGIPRPVSDASVEEPVDRSVACVTDDDCDDGRFCNGRERCLPNSGRVETPDGSMSGGVCRAAFELPCGNLCNEVLDSCRCDTDGDGEIDWACGGSDDDADGDGTPHGSGPDSDCDDFDNMRSPDYEETCDEDHRDEDCDFKTAFAEIDPRKDRDGDGFVSADCYNLDRASLVIHRPDVPIDCDDANSLAFPGGFEECNGVDDDCDGLIDEYSDPVTGAPVDRGQQVLVCRDEDEDRYTSQREADGYYACAIPQGYIQCSPGDRNLDCDDEDALRGPFRDEVCDGVDNDCDSEVDEDVAASIDSDPFTRYACEDGVRTVVACPELTADCDQDARTACEVDLTDFATCGECPAEGGGAATDCRLACSGQSCEEIEALGVGRSFACGLTNAGSVSCWGRGGDGRLGDDRGRESPVPTRVRALFDAEALTVGTDHACAIRENREVVCWGSNRFFQLGTDEASEFSPVPVRVGNGLLVDVVQVKAGQRHTCARSVGPAAGVDGDVKTVRCWGDASVGRLGVADDGSGFRGPVAPVARMELVVVPGLPAPLPLRVRIDDAEEIAVGGDHACLRTTGGAVECWGYNHLGQLGATTQDSFRDFAAPVTLPTGVTQVSGLAAGRNHTCLLAEGRVYCWGSNSHQQLGRGPGMHASVPTEVPGLQDVKHIEAGGDTTCAFATTGEVSCWGKPPGSRDLTAAQAPTPFMLSGLRALSLTLSNACALADEQQVYCWGDNQYGQVGNGTRGSDLVAVPSPIGRRDDDA